MFLRRGIRIPSGIITSDLRKARDFLRESLVRMHRMRHVEIFSDPYGCDGNEQSFRTSLYLFARTSPVISGIQRSS